MIELRVSVNADLVKAKLGALAGVKLAGALIAGLRSALETGRDAVISAARAAGISSRTGTLYDAVTASLGTSEERGPATAAGARLQAGMLARGGRGGGDTAFEGRVGVLDEKSGAQRYAWLLGDRQFAIVPSGRISEVTGRPIQALAIPTALNLSGGGVPRYASPADLYAAFGARVRANPMGIWVMAPGKGRGSRGSSQLFFRFVRSVQARGRNVIGPAMKGAQPAMTGEVQERVDALLAE